MKELKQGDKELKQKYPIKRVCATVDSPSDKITSL